MIGSQSSTYPTKYKMKKKHDFVIKLRNIVSSSLAIALLVISVVVQSNVNYVGCEEQIQSYFGDDPHRSGHYNQYSSSINSHNHNNGLTLDSATFKQGIVKDCLQQCPDQVCVILGYCRKNTCSEPFCHSLKFSLIKKTSSDLQGNLG